MKKLLALFLVLLFSIPAVTFGASEKDNTGLIKDKFGNGAEIQGAVHRKRFQQVPFALSTSTKVLRLKGTLGGGELDFRTATGIMVYSASAISIYYDSDTTKYWTVPETMEKVILIDPVSTATTLVLSGTSTSVEVGGW